MKLDTMRNKTLVELSKESSKLREKLAGLKKDLLIKDVKENSQISKVRKDIARVETIIKEKQLEPTTVKGDK